MGNAFSSVGNIFHCVGFYNNRFFDNLKRASAKRRCRFAYLLPVDPHIIPSEPIFYLQEICENPLRCFREGNRTITEDELHNNEKGNEVSR